MTKPAFLVMPNERGRVRVFSLSMTEEEARRLRTPDNGGPDTRAEALAALLGVESVLPEHVEVFPVKSLEGVGLTGYLTDGLGMPVSAVAADFAKIEALEGDVMIVLSKAFAGKPTEIRPAPALTLIGAYREDATVWEPLDLSSEAATPYSGSGPGPGGSTLPPRRQNMGSVTIIALGAIIMAALYWFLR